MKEEKNIERLFQEKFKEFEFSPPESVWKNIELKLKEKKKKKRVIPFWFKASGIAASLLLGFYMYTFFNTDSTFINPENSTVEKNKNSIEKSSQKNNIKTDKSLIKDESIILSSNENIVNPNKSNDKEEVQSNGVLNQKHQNLIVKTSKKTLSDSKNNFKNKEKLNQKIKDNTINQYEKVSNIIVSENNNTQNKDSKLFKNEIDFDNTNSIFKDKKSSIIIAKQLNNITQDSSLVVKISEEVNTLEQLLKEKEVGKNVEEKEKEMRNKWVVSTIASPVYFNSTSKNSSTLDSRFDSNEKGYNTNISYGLGITYAINNKLSVRTGLSNLNFNSNTKDIVFYQDVRAKPIENVSRNARGRLVNVENKVINEEKSLNSFGNVLTKYDGELNQELGYIEVPLELSYKILDKKFGIDIVGGVSTFLLNTNSVSIVSDNMIMEIGKANNLNSVHFSSNIGLGLRYSVFKSFNVNLNPMFKYQINAYTENSTDLKPYFIGLYSGLSYSF